MYPLLRKFLKNNPRVQQSSVRPCITRFASLSELPACTVPGVQCNELKFTDMCYNMMEKPQIWTNKETLVPVMMTFHALYPSPEAIKRLESVCSDYLLSVKFDKNGSWVNSRTKTLVTIQRIDGSNEDITLEQADKMAVLLSNKKKKQKKHTLRKHVKTRIRCIESILEKRGMSRFTEQVIKNRGIEYNELYWKNSEPYKYSRVDRAYYNRVRREVARTIENQRRWA